MALFLVRCVYLVVAIGLALSLARQFSRDLPPESLGGWVAWTVFGSVLAVALGVLAFDVSVRRKQLDTISAIYFGTIVGSFLSYLLGLGLEPLVGETPQLRDACQLVLSMVLIYLCTSLLLQTRNDFRFIIPYVEFVKETKGLKPYLLDTSVILDGRIEELLRTEIFEQPLLVPQFVLMELQGVADSDDRQRRERGRKALDLLQELSKDDAIDLQIDDRQSKGNPQTSAEEQLVLLAKTLEGKIITNDYSLNQLAQVHGVQVINLNDLSLALKPTYMPGDQVTLRILKPGEESGQGVGYLDDGTMMVVEQAQAYLQKKITAQVTRSLQTKSGRMLFGTLLDKHSS
ncbi:Membrane-associated protein containing RNA-binding TRAM domain and ribonuclease PIN-domain [Planctomycetales bacterium 10988]|nr:Membrane-associated protein containing RNA-binding TRAM domain and ribonuclease PIN-domain [Planctomycetales bacterium 10988]